MLWWRQVQALLWKCYIVRKRHPFTLAFDILLPLLLSAIVAYLFNSILTKHKGRLTVTPSAGLNPGYTPPTIYSYPAYTFPGNIEKEFQVDNSRTILYAPQNSFTDQLMKEVLKIITDSDPFSKRKLAVECLPFKDEPSMVDYKFKASNLSNSMIVFHDTSADITASLAKLSYTLRPPKETSPDTSQLFPYSVFGIRWLLPDYCSVAKNGFITLQALINEAFLKLKAQSLGKTSQPTSWAAWKFPYPPQLARKSENDFLVMVPPLILFGYIVTFPTLVKRIAEEKVNKSREMFKIMGLSDFVYWGTTFFSAYIIYLLQAIILTYIYTHEWQGVMSLLPGAEKSVILAIFVLHGACLMTFGMFLSIPFTKPILAVVFAVVFGTLTFIIPVVLFDPSFNEKIDPMATSIPRFLCCLFPSFSFTTTLGLTSKRALFGMTASWSTLFDSNPSLCLGSMSLGWAMVMMASQVLLYSFLIWYLDKVWPWQDGVPKPWYFPFQIQHWKSVFSCETENRDKPEELDHAPLSRYFERQFSGVPNVISIRKLRKRFGNKMAVDGIDIDVKQGEITCLLGHNGAGKTTTMGMITGLFPATEGTIIVNGYDVASQTSKARESISLCPQHNVLYDELSVLEHLKLYAAIKGLPWAECEKSAVKQAYVTQLSECLKKVPSELSGGMKRKLCLGIALVGDTKLVILDEPTSGLDPEARRMIWDVLREVRRERTILLTTHYMEEADALADSIAIMTAGKISCHGTPIYLKNVFSTGYMLRIAKGEGYDGQAVEDLVRRHFPRGGIKSEIDTEVILALESEDGHTDSSRLPVFFGQLEQLKPKLGVASFGLSLTTLEDVFLKVGQLETSSEETQSNDSSLTQHDANSVSDYRTHSSQHQLDFDEAHVRPDRVQGVALMFERFIGLFLKRVHFGKRYWQMLTMQMLIPALVFGLAMWVSNFFLEQPVDQSLEVTAIKRLYGLTEGFVGNSSKLEAFRLIGEKQGVHFRSVEASENVNDLLLDAAKRVGLSDYIRKHLFGATTNHTGNVETYDLWYQGEAYHALPAVVNMLYESRLNELTDSENQINVFNHEAPIDKGGFQMQVSSSSLTMIIGILMGLSLPFLGASYALFPIHERASQSKLLQLMTGLPVWLFWFVSFLFDMLSHTLASLLILLVVSIVDNHATFTNNSETILSLLVMLMLNGLAAVPIAYCFSCLVKKAGTGYALLVTLYIITGILFGILTQIIQFAVKAQAMSKTAQQIVLFLMKISPMFSLNTGVTKVYQQGQTLTYCGRLSNETLEQKCPIPDLIDPCCPEQYCKRSVFGIETDNCLAPLWSWGDQGIMQEVTMIAVDFVLFSAILIVAHYMPGWTSKASSYDVTTSDSVKDEDVSREENRITLLLDSNNHADEALLVHNLKRRFKQSVAVNGLSFGVHQKEIFGLLGVNGAGKTTTFKMLTGDILPTAGDARSGPLSIVAQRSEFQQQLGYCPQFDALLDKMTGSEMLFLFGRLRGIPEYMLRREVNQLIEMSDLSKHAHKATETYSGGNKRKLSLAISLIGSPKLLLLDEPTSGVDPGARRKIWSTLSHVRKHYGCSIILTSHSMEECEALCSRLAIMVKGQFRCLGPVQHLRNKYGQGYTVVIKIKRDRLDTSHEVQQAVQSSLRGTVLLDAHETVINYHVTDTTVTWTELFENLERIKLTYDLEDYSVSDTTLEQIFISFAKGHDLETASSPKEESATRV
ncbi:Phospholipid-transporting ATPase ABCA3 [Halotydeus destructor]|nr:Phospholipid-transporting ATPase ABCA3 [Halotydeus destructor]